MSKTLTPSFLDSLRKNGTLGGKALRLVEAETLAHLSSEIDRLRLFVLRMVPENWREDRDALEALDHLAKQGVPMALDLVSPRSTPGAMRFEALSAAEAGKLLPIRIKEGDLVNFPPVTPPAPAGLSPAPTIYELKDRALGVLDRRTPKTSQQIAVELGSPDRVDLLAALGQLCAEGMAIREPGTGVYLARTNPCA